jgi:hypothetical protein
MDKAMCELFIGAFFFAMRSCEYLKVTGERKTKLICIKNIRFFQGKRNLPHSDKLLHLADSISITFEQQKRDTKNDIITHHKTGDNLLCPVKIWCKIIRRIISYTSSSADTPVNVFCLPDGSLHHFTGQQVLKQLRRATKTLGPDILGFSEKDIGLHSARSGAAMAMYLAGIPVFTIMLLGQWSSDAFLRYIRKQVKEFSQVVSQKMITKENFFTIPTSTPEEDTNPIPSFKHGTQTKTGINFKDAIRPLINAFT